ncbi:putative inactive tRNA-specific adenosine deaminase-like protein 3-like isoform X1 [Hibiscus syriacus]|uniref:Inactive tRNA-specific adenosine deaminase-like protein 3-like isoform X1 n=1 Tax=Hibiscus syriacus TaxID=106335 RepID=A0A6A3C6S3_HIBSY|nr:putative inactive tRNA-specific adenosine deaminase-like protein 3-like isoform X1 [Hibiscus syriacus]
MIVIFRGLKFEQQRLYHRFFASPRPKQLLATLSNKAIKFVRRKRHGEGNRIDAEAEEIGDGGVWQRAILMGDKCQPLDFSGVIYYDSKGNQVEEPSPRDSPMPAYLSSKNGLIR